MKSAPSEPCLGQFMNSLSQFLKSKSILSAMLVNCYTKYFSKVFEFLIRFSDNPEFSQATSISFIWVLPTALIANFTLQAESRKLRAASASLLLILQGLAVHFYPQSSSDRGGDSRQFALEDVLVFNVFSTALLFLGSCCIKSINIPTQSTGEADTDFDRLVPFVQLPVKMGFGVFCFLSTIVARAQPVSDSNEEILTDMLYCDFSYGGGMLLSQVLLSAAKNLSHSTPVCSFDREQIELFIVSLFCGLAEGLPYWYCLNRADENMDLSSQMLLLAGSTTASIGLSGLLVFCLFRLHQCCFPSTSGEDLGRGLIDTAPFLDAENQVSPLTRPEDAVGRSLPPKAVYGGGFV